MEKKFKVSGTWRTGIPQRMRSKMVQTKSQKAEIDTQAETSATELPFRVLDVSAGNRAVWFNKQYPDAVYVDIRPEMNPDVLADSRVLPASIGDGFALVVFDPPHKNNGPHFGMAKTYGCFDHDHIKSTIAETAKETHRICRDDALMAFKWNDHSIKLTKVVGLLSPYWEPLFGHGVSHQQRSSSTSWVLLRRRDAFNPIPLEMLNSVSEAS